jgi:predicted dehydrogenase
VDAVSIVVPTSQHHKVARGFIRRGVDVMIEKPITTTLPEASELIRMAKQRECILQVGHLERFNEVWKTVGSAIDQPKFIEAHRIGPFQARGTDVDVILDLMIHDIDIVLKYVPAPIERIDSVGVPVLSPNVDIANVRIHFQDGAAANLTASRVSVKRTRKIRFFQRDAYVSVDYDAGKVQVFQRVAGSDGSSPEIVGDEREVEHSDALRTELEAFVESVRTRKPPEVGGAEGKKALQVALRILRNMRTA